MASKMSHAACFAEYGTVPRNPRWSWSGRSPDGKTVSVTFWQDRFERGGTLYRSEAHASDTKWFGSPGHKELLDNLEHALAHCGGQLRIIIAMAKDVKAEPRSIAECFPARGLHMRLIHFDRVTGDFAAERI